MKQIYITISEEYLNDTSSTLTSLAKKYNIGLSTLSNNFRKLGVPLRKTMKTTKIKNLEPRMIEMYNNGSGYEEIAKELGVSQSSIYMALSERQIQTPHSHYHFIESENLTVNENFFEIIDTEAKAYWLGFIAADGCIRNSNNNIALTIEVNTVDLIHLKKFRNDIESNHPIKKRKNKSMCSISIHNKKIVEDLTRLGCCPNKTHHGFISDVIFSLDKHLQCAYLRGYQDGDGYIDKKRHRCIYTVKTYEFSLQLKELIQLATGVEFSIRSEKTYYRVQVENKKGFFQFLDDIYKDVSIILNRKYETYLMRKASQGEILESMSAVLSGELLPDMYDPDDIIIC